MALDPEELAEARAVVDHEQKQRRAGGDPLVGELVVRRRARDVMPFVVLLMLAPIVAGLGQPIPAAALGLATAIAFVLHGGRRVARLSIGADGSLALPGRAAIDFATLRSLELRYRYPWAASERARPHDETSTSYSSSETDRGSRSPEARSGGSGPPAPPWAGTRSKRG
jgi:hypothetical protein